MTTQKYTQTHAKYYYLFLSVGMQILSRLCVSVPVCYASDNGVAWHVYQSKVNTTVLVYYANAKIFYTCIQMYEMDRWIDG